jgi:hypothetical protein
MGDVTHAEKTITVRLGGSNDFTLLRPKRAGYPFLDFGVSLR